VLGACSTEPEPSPRRVPEGAPSSIASSAPPGAGRCLEAEASSKYTVVFRATSAEIARTFLGWRRPVAPRAVTKKNPFTGKDQNVSTTEPEPSAPGPFASAWDLRPRDVRAEGYEAYLEGRVPPEIRALPHRMMKRVETELLVLVEELIKTKGAEIPNALYPPDGCTTALPLERLPDVVTKELRAADASRRAQLAALIAKDAEIPLDGAADLVTQF